VERYLAAARHVEVQILADRHGSVLHLGTRDCSVQRRRQKLIEETPAPGLPSGLADRMCADTVRAVRASGYVGAGTYEFLVDEEGGYHFMEVNCRIQVEHPVTEMVTGVDLIREQIAVAAGHELSLRQADVTARGVAMECRVNAEHPERGFLPTAGQLTEFVVPGGPFTRVDTHLRPGSRVPAEYDPLLAKAIVWAPDRAAAIARMDRVLREFRVAGPRVHTTVGFLRKVLVSPAFRDGMHTVALVDQMVAGNGAAR
jgi:acetyl-CoA carboxylase biotin carboxylase subunit